MKNRKSDDFKVLLLLFPLRIALFKELVIGTVIDKSVKAKNKLSKIIDIILE